MIYTATHRPTTASARFLAFIHLLSWWLLALAPTAATAQAPADLASVTTALEREIEKILDETGIPSIS